MKPENVFEHLLFFGYCCCVCCCGRCEATVMVCYKQKRRMPQPLISRASNYLPRFGFDSKYLLQFLACFPFTIIVILFQAKYAYTFFFFFFFHFFSLLVCLSNIVAHYCFLFHIGHISSGIQHCIYVYICFVAIVCSAKEENLFNLCS